MKSWDRRNSKLSHTTSHFPRLMVKGWEGCFAYVKPPALVGINHATCQLMPNHFIIYTSQILRLPENHKVHKNSLWGCQPDLPTWLPAKLLCYAQSMRQTHSLCYKKTSIHGSGRKHGVCPDFPKSTMSRSPRSMPIWGPTGTVFLYTIWEIIKA